jgi:hypothetical protein
MYQYFDPYYAKVVFDVADTRLHTTDDRTQAMPAPLGILSRVVATARVHLGRQQLIAGRQWLVKKATPNDRSNDG